LSEQSIAASSARDAIKTIDIEVQGCTKKSKKRRKQKKRKDRYFFSFFLGFFFFSSPRWSPQVL
jgi:hypothetical protein